MAGEQGTMNADVGSFLDQLLKPTMQPQPQMRAMPVAPGMMEAQQGSPVQQGAMSSALPTVQQAQGQSLPLPPQYVPPPANMTSELDTIGPQGGGVPWMQILGAMAGAGGMGAVVDALSRGRVPGATGAGPLPSAASAQAPLQGEVIPPIQQRISGTNPESPTIDATRKPPVIANPVQLAAPTPVNQLEQVMQSRLSEAPALPPAAIPMKDANNLKAPLPSQTQQGGMPQGVDGPQAKVGTYSGDTSVPNTSKSPSFDQSKTGRVEAVINEELTKRGVSMEDLPRTAQNRLKDGNFLARAGSGPDKTEALRKFIRGLKIVK